MPISVQQKKGKARRYTLVHHEYIGYGSYVIRYSRVLAIKEKLIQRGCGPYLHFIIEGWPKIIHTDGSVVEA